MFEDGSYLLGGSAPTAGIDATANGAWLASFNADDSPRWSASYDGELGGGLSAVTGLQALPGNGAAVAGFNSMGAKTDGFLFAVDDPGCDPRPTRREPGRSQHSSHQQLSTDVS